MQALAKANTTKDDKLATILVVDDDVEIRELIGQFLTENDYAVLGAGDADEMRTILSSTLVDLIVLDLMLPRVSGLDLCRELRTRSAVPILILTAKDEIVDRILGLELGADDYLTKPFAPRELLARIRAILRRSKSGEPTQSPGGSVIRFARWTLDMRRRELLSPDQVAVELSVTEFDLLMVFIEHPQEVLSRDKLLELTGSKFGASIDRSVDVQISRLRRKFETDEGNPTVIKTVRGAGYRFTPTVSRP